MKNIKETLKKTLWVEKYRPDKIDLLVLPHSVKTTLKHVIETENIPNFLFSGSAGTGKTSAALTICKELDLDYIVINASDDRGIDTLRNKVRSFVSTVPSHAGKQKIVILDEADNLAHTAIMALRGFIEKYSSNARFIFTANYMNKFPEPILSRLQVLQFFYKTEEIAESMQEIFNRLNHIISLETTYTLKKEDIKILVEFIKAKFPDIRKIINQVQMLFLNGDTNEEIDFYQLLIQNDNVFSELHTILKEKAFNKMRKWVNLHFKQDSTDFYRYMWEDGYKWFKDEAVPELVILLSEYLYKDSFSTIKEINTVACLTMIMKHCHLK